MSAPAGWRRLGGDLGAAGWLALALLAGAVLFLYLVVKPLEARNAELARELASAARHPAGLGGVRDPAPAQKLAAFYDYLETDQAPQGWLARLDAIARAGGVELRSAEYRMRDAGARIERYEIALPVSGTYGQVRAFLEEALYEIPVLSLDQVSFSRQRVDDSRIQAELRLTLHLVKP
jgi:Type II secretion system (T2SS), protein M subtype b